MLLGQRGAPLALPTPSLCLPAGAIWFSRGFKEHTNENLRELELGYNEIKDEGACALAQVPLSRAAWLPCRAVGGGRAGGSHVAAARFNLALPCRADSCPVMCIDVAVPATLETQALKANPEGAPKEFKINANYLTKFGQVRPVDLVGADCGLPGVPQSGECGRRGRGCATPSVAPLVHPPLPRPCFAAARWR